MKAYTREEIEQGFKNWNAYVSGGGLCEEYNAMKTTAGSQCDSLISFIEEKPLFPSDISTKHQEG